MPRDRRADRLMRAFGRRLRAARITAGYEDAAEFAADLGIEAPRYRKWERGQSFVPLPYLIEISALTGRSSDWLLLGRNRGRERQT